MTEYGPIKTCQGCDSPRLTSALFLGYLPPVNTMHPLGSFPDKEPRFPAEMLYCPHCHLVQLGYAVDPRILFPPEYPYTSSSTRILRENFADLFHEICKRIVISKDDLVVDIGSNDGTLLSNFAQRGHRVVGVEPSLTAKIAEGQGIPTLMTFFNKPSMLKIKNLYGEPKIVTATNVFAHIHDIHEVIENIADLIGQKGIFISESHYLGDLVKTLQYDTIYHEHLRYYSLTSLKYLLERHGFRIFYVKRIPTHGGSVRVYATLSEKHPVDPTVDQMLQEEKENGLISDSWIEQFRKRVVDSKLDLYRLLAEIKQTEHGPIYGIGAPSRASTLINYLGLDSEIINCVLEIHSSKKLHYYVPGTRIPILEESKLYQDQPPFVLLLSWHIATELCSNLRRQGYKGDFIIPLPKPHVIRNWECFNK